jgi:hypothetical protein
VIDKKVSAEELGGAAMHSAISEPWIFTNRMTACPGRIRSIIENGDTRDSPRGPQETGGSGAGGRRNLWIYDFRRRALRLKK